MSLKKSRALKSNIRDHLKLYLRLKGNKDFNLTIKAHFELQNHLRTWPADALKWALRSLAEKLFSLKKQQKKKS